MHSSLFLAVHLVFVLTAFIIKLFSKCIIAAFLNWPNAIGSVHKFPGLEVILYILFGLVSWLH